MFIMIWVQGYQQLGRWGSVVECLTRDQGVASMESLCCFPILNPYTLLLHYVNHDLGPRLSAVGALGHCGSVEECLTRDQGVASTESLCFVPILNPYTLLLHYVYHDLGPSLSAVGALWLSGRVLDSRPKGCLYGVTVLCPHLKPLYPAAAFC